MTNILLAGILGLSLLIPARVEVYTKTVADIPVPKSRLEVTYDKKGNEVVVDASWTKDMILDVVSHSKHPERLKTLGGCESQFRAIKKMDSNDLYSYGYLQFQKQTWDEWSKNSGIIGDPMNVKDATQMADWAIDHNLGSHWTCWKLKGLDKK